ncbi:MAG: HAMP domain-containing protein [Clostridiales bacterium]|nr:HAMP domain-containing protein [Clostridiales bacterium]
MSKMSHSYKNFSIKARVIVLVAIMLIFSALIGIFGFFSLLNVNGKYELMLGTASERLNLSSELELEVAKFRRAFLNVIVQSEIHQDKTRTTDALNELNSHLEKITDITDRYKACVDSDTSLTPQAQQNLYNLRQKFLDDFLSVGDLSKDLGAACLAEDFDGINRCLSLIVEKVETAYDNVANIRQVAIDRRDVLDDEATTTARVTEIVLIAVLFLALIFSLAIAIIITNSIVKPIVHITKQARKAAEGDFSVDVRTNITNEVGQLSNSLGMFIDTTKNVFDDMVDAFREMEYGNLDKRLNTSKYNGQYSVMAETINKILSDTAHEFTTISKSINEYAEGNFSYDCPRFNGQKAIIHESLDKMKEHIQIISSSISEITDNINNGNLDIEISTNNLKSAWKKIIESLNILVINVAEPIRVTKDSLSNLAAGNFNFSIDADRFKGEFNEMAENINYTIKVLSEYIAEISSILKNMANQNLNVEITHNYVGDFKEIQDSLNLIIANFNQLIKEIIMSSEQVAIGSQSIADSSTALAQGASEQASAVEELTATIGLVSKNAERNTENVIKSNELADTAKESATRIRDEMQDLLKAMDDINESSNNISNIIKVIDDIAFQTNILALNAAVEAARAGEHGKGFAVVADEVRTLAARSQTSAQETSDLIAESLSKAEQGSEIVNRTADTVRKIVNQIDEISTLSNEVAHDSKEQTNSISEINIGINQIATVVSNNTATSEESAAASEELASQSAVFKSTVSKFTLKNQGYSE